MVDATIEDALSACLDELAVEQQRQVLEFARTLTLSPVPGRQGARLLRFAGTIDASDLDAMSQAIKDGCERSDHDEW
ncbi:hypothetical protein [Planctomicrobium piriforme]|uniref:Uncharacterized protein n=1 Tax=Planctomicrobium piriforme TaxID=1576369 RepID=A0A1I3LVH0_9PLAN|nr:hypothetical protein [Planctomicrobium piriforme]SFI88768.1 hypothetical protein SAMN05421753_11378 [Planctomicrobium piriforme]